MTLFNKALLAAVFGAGAIAFSATGASAAIVCNDDVCWHVKEKYTYPSEARVTIHPDDWRWGPRERFTWREHEGRGYWRGDRWMEW